MSVGVRGTLHCIAHHSCSYLIMLTTHAIHELEVD